MTKFRLLPFLIPLAGLTGYLLSKASWVGRAGINVMYRQYKFLNLWWQAGLAVLAVWLVLYFLQRIDAIALSPKKAKLYSVVAAVVGVTGLAFAVYDFQNTATHRMLGARFHWGAYLFFIGWFLILADGWFSRRAKPLEDETKRRPVGV